MEGVKKDCENILSKLKLEKDEPLANRKTKIFFVSSGRSTLVPVPEKRSESVTPCSTNKMDMVTTDYVSKIKIEPLDQLQEECLSGSEYNLLGHFATEEASVSSSEYIKSELLCPGLSPSDILTIVMEEGESFDSGIPNIVDKEVTDPTNEILLKMQQKGVYQQFEEECFADCESKAEKINLAAKIENVVDNLLQRTDWITKDITMMSEDQLDEYMHDYLNSCVDSDLSALVNQAVDAKVEFFLKTTEKEFASYFGISRPDDIDPDNEETSSEIKIVDLNTIVECETNDQEEDDENISDDMETDEEEESPAFEKIGETPPSSPQKSIPAGENKESSTKLPCENHPVITTPRNNQIPDDVDGSPVYYLELPDMFAEKLKFFNELKLQHQDDSSDEQD